MIVKIEAALFSVWALGYGLSVTGKLCQRLQKLMAFPGAGIAGWKFSVGLAIGAGERVSPSIRHQFGVCRRPQWPGTSSGLVVMTTLFHRPNKSGYGLPYAPRRFRGCACGTGLTHRHRLRRCIPTAKVPPAHMPAGAVWGRQVDFSGVFPVPVIHPPHKYLVRAILVLGTLGELTR